MSAFSNSIAPNEWRAPALPSEYRAEHWYAAYTSANHEKKSAVEISRRGVESFLPVYRAVRRWSDRRVELDMPLFPGYVFVRLALQDRLCVLQVPGVAKLVGFGSQPTAIPDDQINILRSGLSQRLHAQPHPYLTAGRRVRVSSGPFQGLEGIIVRRNNRNRLVISLELIQRSVAVEVNGSELELATPASVRTVSASAHG